jgi:heme/copper-type cytochrome/quinol oxidase subunit 4
VISFLRSRVGLVLVASLAIVGFFVVLEHRVHLSGYLPYALLALFVMLHVFMHAGHGGHGGGGRGSERERGSGGDEK